MKSLAILLFAISLCFPVTSQEVNPPVDSDFEFFELNKLTEKLDSSNGVWLPFFKGEHVLTGIYKLKTGATDQQQPHDTDEVYYVIQGVGKFKAGDQNISIRPGCILFVKADVQHQFYDIEEDITLLVFFDQ